ncbi:MAG: hypothetical protein LBJ90_06670 [Treponema sp.]|nr:hypothetical protein [Treponema sp.]
MPLRLIEFIIVFAVFLVFIAFNLENKCDISFGFRTMKDVPVFLTAFSSFIFGMLCAVPFIVGARARKKAGKDGGALPEKPKKKWGKKKEESAPPSSGSGDNTFSDGGPYGVN